MSPTTLTAEGTHCDAFEANDWLLFARTRLIWGASFLFVAKSLDAFAPGLIKFAGISFGCIALGLVPATRNAVPRSAWPRIVAVSVTWLAFPMTLFPIAQQHILVEPRGHAERSDRGLRGDRRLGAAASVARPVAAGRPRCRAPRDLPRTMTGSAP